MSTSNLVGVYGVIWGCVQIQVSHVISVISISHGHKVSTISVPFLSFVWGSISKSPNLERSLFFETTVFNDLRIDRGFCSSIFCPVFDFSSLIQ